MTREFMINGRSVAEYDNGDVFYGNGQKVPDEVLKKFNDEHASKQLEEA